MSGERRERARKLQGRRAGFVSRVVAAGIDVALVLAAYELILIAVGVVEALFEEQQFELPTPSVWISSSSLVVLFVFVLAASWAGSGRTFGDTLLGLRVLRDTGADLTFGRALVRAIVLLAIPVVSMGWILVSRKNAGIHDLVCRTTVVYDWRPRHHTRALAPEPEPDPEAQPAPVAVTAGARIAAAGSESRQDR